MTVARARKAAFRWPLLAVAAAVAGCLASAFPALAEASLPSAPFEVSVAVTSGGSGNDISLSLEPRPGPVLDASARFDLYVALLQGFQEALFLTGSGSWSPRPASVRHGLSMAGFDPVTVRWSEQRFGSLHLLVIAARPSSDPLAQASWVFRPVLRTVDVRARLADSPDPLQASLVLGGLGALSVVAVALVMWLPRPRGSDGAVSREG
ncbi:MAG TPA: hypothetical protein VEL75_22790 [Candidatus Methylomirabilis sp.]|nr:hypothetical protein [Candidatus Methylomirabilis sp.]